MVYVLADSSAELTSELITAARPLGPVTAVVIGENSANFAELGAERVVRVAVADRIIFPAVDALVALAANEPAPIVVAAGPTGNEIAGRVAVRLSAGVLTDVVAINADGTATQSIFGDTITVSSAAGGATPVYTVRPGAVTPEPQAAAGEELTIGAAAPSALEPTVTSFTPATPSKRPELSTAKVVVAGGRGVGGREGFDELVEPLADALGAAVGVTRDVVDEGHYDGKYQVGQTGVTVSPDLYIALGISGAIQHKSGMQTSNTIVAINTDEDAPIFEIADLGVVADVHEVVPALLEAIKES
ncbi:MAG: electron transfer flavoprotein subunit alpha/FixB family protein [Corynebacterium sp.]|nr:electron transfer flavoprotein subunit alpha/FixB family protein [Corynebacterium sp.]